MGEASARGLGRREHLSKSAFGSRSCLETYPYIGFFFVFLYTKLGMAAARCQMLCRRCIKKQLTHNLYQHQHQFSTSILLFRESSSDKYGSPSLHFILTMLLQAEVDYPLGTCLRDSELLSLYTATGSCA